MEQAPRRTTIRGPTFIHLLARLTDVDVPHSKQSLSDRLSQWFDWTHAIALSTALDGKLPAASPAAAADGEEESECTRVHAALVQAITGNHEPASSGQRGAGRTITEEAGANAAIDYSAFRQRYLAMQRAMLTATGNLRGRLRDKLAQRSAEMARLAEMDAVMERALSPREQTLLSSVPGLLGKHFERLQQAGQKTPEDPPISTDTPAATLNVWLDVFRKDMQSVLLAELDVRFQPVEGLLAALRTR